MFRPFPSRWLFILFFLPCTCFPGDWHRITDKYISVEDGSVKCCVVVYHFLGQAGNITYFSLEVTNKTGLNLYASTSYAEPWIPVIKRVGGVPAHLDTINSIAFHNGIWAAPPRSATAKWYFGSSDGIEFSQKTLNFDFTGNGLQPIYMTAVANNSGFLFYSDQFAIHSQDGVQWNLSLDFRGQNRHFDDDVLHRQPNQDFALVVEAFSYVDRYRYYFSSDGVQWNYVEDEDESFYEDQVHFHALAIVENTVIWTGSAGDHVPAGSIATFPSYISQNFSNPSKGKISVTTTCTVNPESNNYYRIFQFPENFRAIASNGKRLTVDGKCFSGTFSGCNQFLLETTNGKTYGVDRICSLTDSLTSESGSTKGASDLDLHYGRNLIAIADLFPNHNKQAAYYRGSDPSNPPTFSLKFINPVGDKDGKIQVELKPVGMTLDDAMEKLGIDHFNWLNIITGYYVSENNGQSFRKIVAEDYEGTPSRLPFEHKILLTDQFGNSLYQTTPTFDPPHGGYNYNIDESGKCSTVTSLPILDQYDWYFDEVVNYVRVSKAGCPYNEMDIWIFGGNPQWTNQGSQGKGEIFEDNPADVLWVRTTFSTKPVGINNGVGKSLSIVSWELPNGAFWVESPINGDGGFRWEHDGEEGISSVNTYSTHRESSGTARILGPELIFSSSYEE